MPTKPLKKTARGFFVLGILIASTGFATGLAPVGLLGVGLVLFALLSRAGSR